MTNVSSAAPGTRHIKVDTEHFGIRFLVPVLVIGIAVAFHFVALSVLDSLVDFNVQCLVLPLDALMLFLSAYVVERILKAVLPSRRSATLNDEALALSDARRSPPEVRQMVWDRMVNVQAWRFVVRRRTRVPKGWICMAVHLLQDETEIILYTFMAPEAAEKVPGYPNFVRLRPRRETESNTDLHAVAQQRRLLKLEDARWHDGAEIGPDDFRALLAYLERHVPDWA
jgi:hypothetical protein